MKELVASLLQNGALLLAMVAALDLSARGQRWRHPLAWNMIVGLVLGLVGICLMLTGHAEGGALQLDSRTVLLSLSGLFFGAVPSLVAVVVTSVFRPLMGENLWAGLAVTAVSVALGLIWRRRLAARLHQLAPTELYVFGLAVHLAVLLVVTLFAGAESREALPRFGVSLLLVQPVATLVVGIFLVDRLRRDKREEVLAESEERYRSIFEDSRSVMLLVEPKTDKIIDANSAAEGFYGRKTDVLLGQRLSDLAAAPVGAESRPGVVVHRHASGELREVEILSSPVLVAEQSLLFAIVHDVTERRQAETALRESETRFRRLFVANPHPMWVYDLETLKFLDVNDAAISHYGYSREEFLAMAITEIRPPEEARRLLETLAGPREPRVEPSLWRHRKKDGTEIDVEITAHLLEFGARRAQLVLADDVTKRLAAERALRESEQRWQFALEGAGDGVWDWNIATNSVFLSRRWHEMLGYKIGDVPNEFSKMESLVHPEDAASGKRAMADCLKGKAENYECELRLRCFDGSFKWVLARGRVIERGPDARALRMIGTHTDITERRRANERLLLLDTAIQAMPVGVVITDRDGRIQWVNGGFCRMTGYVATDVIGKPSRILKSGRHSDDFYRKLWQTIQRGEVWSGEMVNRRKDGSEYSEHMVVAPVAYGWSGVTHYVAMKQDITAQQRLEQQLARAQRLESIGLLASGIAHDLNNVLTPITVSVEFLKEDFPDSNAQARLDLIGQAAQRGAGIVRQVLTFARGEGGERRLLDPNLVLKEIAHFARETLPRNIEIKIEGLVPGALVEGDMTQLHQALLNLVLNACDAMPDGGVLRLRRREVEIDDASAKLRSMNPGRYVELSVSDSGTGIAPEVMDHIFDPFFTTKPRGKGTGLGLSAVYGIARGHGGTVEVDSTPNVGSSFTLLLPAATEPEITAVQQAGATVPAGQGRLILVVDDEAPIRELTSIILRRRGFEVLVAEDGVEALELFKTRAPTEWSLALVDMMMPRKGGRELIREMRDLAPNLPVISTSGYMPRDWMTAASASADMVVLPKPFTEQQLMSAMASAYERPGEVN